MKDITIFFMLTLALICATNCQSKSSPSASTKTAGNGNFSPKYGDSVTYRPVVDGWIENAVTGEMRQMRPSFALQNDAQGTILSLKIAPGLDLDPIDIADGSVPLFGEGSELTVVSGVFEFAGQTVALTRFNTRVIVGPSNVGGTITFYVTITLPDPLFTILPRTLKISIGTATSSLDTVVIAPCMQPYSIIPNVNSENEISFSLGEEPEGCPELNVESFRFSVDGSQFFDTPANIGGLAEGSHDYTLEIRIRFEEQDTIEEPEIYYASGKLVVESDSQYTSEGIPKELGVDVNLNYPLCNILGAFSLHWVANDPWLGLIWRTSEIANCPSPTYLEFRIDNTNESFTMNSFSLHIVENSVSSYAFPIAVTFRFSPFYVEGAWNQWEVYE